MTVILILKLLIVRRGNKCASFTASSAASAKTLFQNRCVQGILLLLVTAIAVSIVSMASVYIMDYQNRKGDTDEHIWNESDRIHDQKG